MHPSTAAKLMLGILFLTISTHAHDGDHSNKNQSVLAFRRVEPRYRASVVEGIYANTQPALLETLTTLTPPNDTLPVLNTTVTFKLPFDVERSLSDLARNLYLQDPLGFRMRARKKAENRERRRELFDDFEGDLNDTVSAASSLINALPTAVQSRIDRVLSSVESRLSVAATKTDNDEVYATSVMESLISDALVSNLGTATAFSPTGSFAYETMTTTYAAVRGVEAFVTSYLVLVQVSETGSATTTEATGTASVAGQSAATISSTGGGGKVYFGAAATLGLVGLAMQAVL